MEKEGEEVEVGLIVDGEGGWGVSSTITTIGVYFDPFPLEMVGDQPQQPHTRIFIAFRTCVTKELLCMIRKFIMIYLTFSISSTKGRHYFISSSLRLYSTFSSCSI